MIWQLGFELGQLLEERNILLAELLDLSNGQLDAAAKGFGLSNEEDSTKPDLKAFAINAAASLQLQLLCCFLLIILQNVIQYICNVAFIYFLFLV